MLRVVQAFGGYAVGDSVTDSAECDAVLASDQAAFVVAAADLEPEVVAEPGQSADVTPKKKAPDAPASDQATPPVAPVDSTSAS